MSMYYFVGSGIASLAGAVFLIRDGHVPGTNIVIFEESSEFGGALDAHGDARAGYYMSGSRMFEQKYNCTFDLLLTIPSTSDPALSVTEETNLAETEARWCNKARLVDRNHQILDAHALGLRERDRLDLVALMATPEKLLDGKRIADWFSAGFFETNFWFEWCTLFAFQRWHSAIEFKRYLVRFIHHFSTIDTQAGVYRTRYNQYDSIAVPLVKWLRGSTNLAFIGQFSELPDDVVFTVEYSVRSAQTAVYALLKIDRKPIPIYRGSHDPRVLFEALETLHR